MRKHTISSQKNLFRDQKNSYCVDPIKKYAYQKCLTKIWGEKCRKLTYV